MKSMPPSEPMSWIVTILGWFSALAGLGFLQEALLARSERQLRRQDLDRDRAVQADIPGLVNDTQPPSPSLRFDPVVVERGADHQDTCWLVAHVGEGYLDEVEAFTTVNVTLDGYCFEWCTALRATTPLASS